MAGTVALLTTAKWKDDEIPALLSSFDEYFLPGVDLASGNLSFTVIRGEVVGNYQATT